MRNSGAPCRLPEGVLAGTREMYHAQALGEETTSPGPYIPFAEAK